MFATNCSQGGVAYAPRRSGEQARFACYNMACQGLTISETSASAAFYVGDYEDWNRIAGNVRVWFGSANIGLVQVGGYGVVVPGTGEKLGGGAIFGFGFLLGLPAEGGYMNCTTTMGPTLTW